jgi:aromatic amino acid aminotransferase I
MALKGDHDSIEEEIFLSAVQNQVLLSRGSWFKANSAQQEKRMFFRATFAAASPEKMIEAIRRFSDVLRVQFHMTS